jgi:hypothetical protein
MEVAEVAEAVVAVAALAEALAEEVPALIQLDIIPVEMWL